MNFDLLQAFQTAVNGYGLRDGNARVQMAQRDDVGASLRKVECGTPTGERNNTVRCAFKEALVHAFGVKRLEELPKEVKAVLKIGDFRLSKDGEVLSTRPLTMRRVKAVMNAVNDVTKSALQAGDETKMFERALVSGFEEQDREVLERAMSRIAIVSGRQPMKFTFPNGVEVSVPLSSLKAYTGSIPTERLAASIDDLHDQIQRDIKEGCAIYECLKGGRQCEHSVEAARKLRHYLSFMAVAAGKSGNSRVVSVPDVNGKVADFLKLDSSTDTRRLKANESITGSVSRVFFVSSLECLGKSVAPKRQPDVERRYRKLAENSRSSRVLQRKAEQGGLTIAQMYANVKAEMSRISTVGYEELLLDARKELGNPDATDDEMHEMIGNTKAFRDFCSYRCDLSEFMLHLKFSRGELDHPEMRIGDEVVLTELDLKRISDEADVNQVLSPRGAPERREIRKPSSIQAEGAYPVGSSEWCKKLVESCYGENNFRDGLCLIAKCMRFGLHPVGKEPPQEYDRIIKQDEAFAAFAEYINGLDKEWLADLEWYVKSGAILADNEVVEFAANGPRREGERPLWAALKRGVVDREFPEHLCREMVKQFKSDDPDQPFSDRLRRRNVRYGMEYPTDGNAAEKAASVSWGFGTYDIERILTYVKDCGFKIAEVTASDLGKLSVLAMVCDFKLEEAPTFIQRQTGKTLSEITTKDIVSLLKLKFSGRLNDKGARLRGAVGEAVSILKGEKLPSMTQADGRDVIHLLSALRTLSDSTPGAAIVTDFRGRKLALRQTLSGALVFNIGGFEFRAAKRAHEFVEMIEDDAVGNVDKFGAGVVSGILPQVRGALISHDSTERSRSRELCLRYLKSSAGIDPSSLSSVSTREIFKIAEAVADDRYSLRTGKVSEKIVRTMLDRTIDLNAMTSQEAMDLYRSIRSNLDDVPDVELAPIVTRRQPSQMPDDVRDVHEFLADIVFDADPFDFENARSGDLDMRVVDVMRRHVRTLVKIAKKPELVTTFPQNIVGEISEFMGSAFVFLPGNFAQSVSDDELRRTFEFFLDNINKGKNERELAAEEFIRQHLPPRPVPQPVPQPVQGGLRSKFQRFGSAIKNTFTGRSEPVAAEPSVEQAQSDERWNVLNKEMLLASLAHMSLVVKGVETLVAGQVPKAMETVQLQLSEQLSGVQTSGNSGDAPVWSMDFEEIVGGAMTDPESGYGKFMHEVMSTYFTSSSPLDQRRMLASLIRNVDENASLGAMAGALFKGAGPLLQKMLQGLPPAALGEDLSIALDDMKSNLLPLPESYVKACMRRMIDRSGGRISSIRVERSLGAASVGQAFLCKMVTETHPEGEECVVKLLRPTVKTAIVRERKLFEDAAAKVDGMAKTFEGQLARILDELDLTLESTNVNFGRGVYEQPVYLRQTSLLNNSEIRTLNLTSLHSMEVHPLVTPTMDCLVLKKAPGETYDRYMKDMVRHLDDMMAGKELVDGRYRLPNFAELIHFRKELVGMYNETLKRQRFLVDLTKKWAHEGLFGGGFYHGDLHAGNIMTDGKGLTVIDFGNATHLTEMERTHVLRMISAALVGWNDMFESSFKALLSEKGRAEYDGRNEEGQISRALAEVLKKGHGNDVGMRIAAALMLLQKNGIEVPGPIYNFNQCQMRLGGTVDAMNALLGRMRSILTRLEIPRLVYDAGERDSALSELIDPASEMVNEIMRFVERPFGGGEALQDIHVDMEHDVFGKFSNTVVPLSECYLKIMEELKDEEHSRVHIYPLIEQLQEMRTVGFKDVPLNNAGYGIDLKKMFAEYLKKEERTDEDRKKLAIQMYKVIFEMHSIVPNLLEQKLDGIEESFLMAVGESISDSLYTVRTTLGNITSVKLMNAQKAEGDLIAKERERMRDSDLRVRSYRAARPESALDGYGVSVIKETAKRMYFPFDLPGLDGRKDWLHDENARRRIYAAILTNVKRLLAELEEQRVFYEDATMVTRIEATCIAMQYLVDRVGGLFDAFKGIDNRTQQRIMVELRDFLSGGEEERREADADARDIEEVIRDIDDDRFVLEDDEPVAENEGVDEPAAEGVNAESPASAYEAECTKMAVLYLLQGGSQPAQEEPVPDLGPGQRPVQAAAQDGGNE